MFPVFGPRAVDELEIGQIHEGQEAHVRIEAFHDAWLPARVDRIGTQSDEAGAQEIPVTLHLDDYPGLVPPHEPLRRKPN